MAIFQKLTHLFTATQTSLSSTLFNSPPFQSFTIFLLEVSTNLSLHHSPTQSHFLPIHKTHHLSHPVTDIDEDLFHRPDAVVAGFVLIFSNYSSFLAEPGFYFEDVFVREKYRRRGLRSMLIKAVATTKAVELG